MRNNNHPHSVHQIIRTKLIWKSKIKWSIKRNHLFPFIIATKYWKMDMVRKVFKATAQIILLIWVENESLELFSELSGKAIFANLKAMLKSFVNIETSCSSVGNLLPKNLDIRRCVCKKSWKFCPIIISQNKMVLWTCLNSSPRCNNDIIWKEIT